MKKSYAKSLVLSSLCAVTTSFSSIGQTPQNMGSIVSSIRTNLFERFDAISDTSLSHFVQRIQAYKCKEIEVLWTQDTMTAQHRMMAIEDLHTNFSLLRDEATLIARGKFSDLIRQIQVLEPLKERVRKNNIDHDSLPAEIVVLPNIRGHNQQPVIWIYDTYAQQYYNLEVIDFNAEISISYRTTTDPRDPSITSDPILIFCESKGVMGGDGIDVVCYPKVSLYQFLSILEDIAWYNNQQTDILFSILDK